MGKKEIEGKDLKVDKNVKKKMKWWLFWLMGVSK